MADDELSRRRRYDDRVPAIEYIEEKLLRAFEEGLRDTRHALKQDIAALATTVTDNALKATKEHGDVRADLERVRADVNELRRELQDLEPLQDSVAELQEHDRTDLAVSEALERNRLQIEKNRVQVRNWALALAGLIATLATAATAVVALFLH